MTVQNGLEMALKPSHILDNHLRAYILFSPVRTQPDNLIQTVY
jgi:hypothetical protein